LNRTFTQGITAKTSSEAGYGTKPNVHYLRTFDCVAHVKSAHPHLKKLDDRSTRMVFVGYESGTKAYRVFDPVAGRVDVSRDVVFDEDTGWDWSRDRDTPVDSTFTVEYFALSHTDARTRGTGEGAAGATTETPD